MLLLLLCLLLLHILLGIFPTDYKFDAIFKGINAELRDYFLELFPLFLETVAEFPREGVSLLRALAELGDNLIGLL
jgi:predicted nuclease with RNAse H fold